MRSRKRTLDQFVEEIKQLVRELGKEFTDPDDDWAPALFIETKNGVGVLGMDTLPPNPLKRILFVDVLPQVIKATAQENGGGPPLRVAFLSSAWTFDKPEHYQEFLEDDSMETFQDHPEHKEMLSLSIGEKSGETRLYTAKIFRDGEQPPALQEWDDHSGADKYDGNVMKMIRRALA